MDIVLDCSVVMAWCFDEVGSAYAEKVVARFRDDRAFVPLIWPLEVANSLLVAERRKRITRADNARFVELIRTMPVELDPETGSRALGDTLPLARRTNLSAYDAAYLELAVRRALPLATLDAPLKKAARRLRVAILR